MPQARRRHLALDRQKVRHRGLNQNTCSPGASRDNLSFSFVTEELVTFRDIQASATLFDPVRPREAEKNRQALPTTASNSSRPFPCGGLANGLAQARGTANSERVTRVNQAQRQSWCSGGLTGGASAASASESAARAC